MRDIYLFAHSAVPRRPLSHWDPLLSFAKQGAVHLLPVDRWATIFPFLLYCHPGRHKWKQSLNIHIIKEISLHMFRQSFEATCPNCILSLFNLYCRLKFRTPLQRLIFTDVNVIVFLKLVQKIVKLHLKCIMIGLRWLFDNFKEVSLLVFYRHLNLCT